VRRRVVQNCLQKKRTRTDIETSTRQILRGDMGTPPKMIRHQSAIGGEKKF